MNGLIDTQTLYCYGSRPTRMMAKNTLLDVRELPLPRPAAPRVAQVGPRCSDARLIHFARGSDLGHHRPDGRGHPRLPLPGQETKRQ